MQRNGLLIQQLKAYPKLRLVAYLLYAIIGVILCSRAYSIDSSSYLYLEQAPNVGGFYPFFIWLIALTKWKFYLNIVVICQVIIMAFAIILFLNTLQKALKINNFIPLILALLFLYPYLTYSDLIGTEAFAFSFFLLFTTSIIEILYLHKRRHVGIVLFWFYFLLLTHAQFLFLIPILWIILAFSWLTKRIRFRYFVGSVIGSLFVLYVVSMSMGFYNFKFNKFYTFEPVGQLNSFCNSLYLSKKTDSIQFKYESDSLSYAKIQSNIGRNNLTFESKFTGLSPNSPQVIVHFRRSIPLILAEVKKEIARTSDDGSLNSIANWVKMKKLANEATKQIIQKNLFDFINLFWIKLYMIGFKSISMFVVFLALMIYSFCQYKKPIFLYIAFTSLLHISNLIIIDYGSVLEIRYTFYTEVVYLSSLILAVFQFIIHKNKKTVAQ